MYELIEITTKNQIGIFASYTDAVRWIEKNGTGKIDDYRIFPW